MTTTIKVSRSDKAIKAILVACYPEWKGRKVRVKVAHDYQMSDYWSEGSRNFVRAYSLEDGRTVEAVGLAQIPMSDLAHARVGIPAGVALVEHSVFCGKDAGVTIYLGAADAPRALTDAGMAQLPASERMAGASRLARTNELRR